MKKILAILTATVLSLSAQAQLTYITGLYKDKTVDVINDSTYNLRLESWANGTTVLEEKMQSKNANVVLVIDESGSMGYNYGSQVGSISSNGITVRDKDDKNDINIDKSIYYYGRGKGIVRWSEEAGKWQYFESNNWKNIDSTTKIYICGFSAIATAAQRLLDNLAADVRMCKSVYGQTVTHKIAIYSFASSSSGKLKSLTSVSNATDSAKIINTILSLSMGGGTYPASSLSNAVTLLNSSKSSDVTSNIVFFTDGAPGDGYPDEDASEMKNAITNVNSAKGSGTKVFTIGYLNKLSTNAVAFMEGVSSDYPNATNYDALGTRTDSCYYKNTSDPMQLLHYFDNVSMQIAKEAKTYTVDATTQVRDTLTSEFRLPEDSKINLKTYTVNCINVDSDGNPVFGTAKSDTASITGLTVTIGTDRKSICVKGFDFGANFCGKHYNSSLPGQISYGGKKLILEFNILTTDQFKGGLDIGTNTKYSGIYPNGGNVLGTKFISPAVAGPVDLIVTSNTLASEHESMIFKVTRRADGASVDDALFGQNGVYEIILSAPEYSDTIKQCLTKVDNDNTKASYYYTVETQSVGRNNRWDWRYNETTDADRKQTHTLHDGASFTNKFEFTRTPKSGLPTTAEDINTQIIP